MTISSETRKTELFVGNDVTVAFPFAFKVFSEADIMVVRSAADTGVETILELTTDYSVALNGEQNSNPGGVVTLLVAPTAAQRLIIVSDMEFLQPVDLQNQGAYYPKVVSDALDRVTVLTQQLSEIVGRTLRGPVSDPGATTLPPRATRKGKVLAFDETTGDPLEGPANDALASIVANMDNINTVASIPWQLFGVVIATDIDITYTGGAAGTYSATFVQPVLTVTNGVPFPDTDKTWTSGFSISGGSATGITVNNLQSMAGGFSVYPSTTTSITFPDLVYANGGMAFGSAALTTVNCPVLRTAATITLSGAALTSPSFPALVSGGVVASGASLTAVSFPALTTTDNASVSITGGAITAVNFPALTTTGSGVLTLSGASLTSPSFPVLESAARVRLSGASLTSPSLPALVSTVGFVELSGASLTTPDLSALTTIAPGGGVDGYLELSGASLTSPAFPSLTSVGGDITLSGASLVSPDFSALTTVGGAIILSGASLASPDFSALTTASAIDRTAGAASTLGFPSLTTFSSGYLDLTITGGGLASVDFSSLTSVVDLYFTATGTITSLAFPALTYVSRGGRAEPFVVSTPTVTSISLPVFEHLDGNVCYFNFTGSGITALALPSLIRSEDGLQIFGAAITSVTLGTTLQFVGGDFAVGADVALDQASVDNILVRLAALDGTGGTTSYDNKTVILANACAAPSATGAAAKVVLEGRGNNVQTN